MRTSGISTTRRRLSAAQLDPFCFGAGFPYTRQHNTTPFLLCVNTTDYNINLCTRIRTTYSAIFTITTIPSDDPHCHHGSSARTQGAASTLSRRQRTFIRSACRRTGPRRHLRAYQRPPVVPWPNRLPIPSSFTVDRPPFASPAVGVPGVVIQIERQFLLFGVLLLMAGSRAVRPMFLEHGWCHGGDSVCMGGHLT